MVAAVGYRQERERREGSKHWWQRCDTGKEGKMRHDRLLHILGSYAKEHSHATMVIAGAEIQRAILSSVSEAGGKGPHI